MVVLLNFSGRRGSERREDQRASTSKTATGASVNLAGTGAHPSGETWAGGQQEGTLFVVRHEALVA